MAEALHPEVLVRPRARESTAAWTWSAPDSSRDCLETLEEIAIEGQGDLPDAGGREFHYIPCLNERHEWIAALTDLAERNLRGWIERQPPSSRPLGIV